jgi:hypothetical protein
VPSLRLGYCLKTTSMDRDSYERQVLVRVLRACVQVQVLHVQYEYVCRLPPLQRSLNHSPSLSQPGPFVPVVPVVWHALVAASCLSHP